MCCIYEVFYGNSCTQSQSVGFTFIALFWCWMLHFHYYWHYSSKHILCIQMWWIAVSVIKQRQIVSVRGYSSEILVTMDLLCTSLRFFIRIFSKGYFKLCRWLLFLVFGGVNYGCPPFGGEIFALWYYYWYFIKEKAMYAIAVGYYFCNYASLGMFLSQDLPSEYWIKLVTMDPSLLHLQS